MGLDLFYPPRNDTFLVRVAPPTLLGLPQEKIINESTELLT